MRRFRKPCTVEVRDAVRCSWSLSGVRRHLPERMCGAAGSCCNAHRHQSHRVLLTEDFPTGLLAATVFDDSGAVPYSAAPAAAALHAGEAVQAHQARHAPPGHAQAVLQPQLGMNAPDTLGAAAVLVHLPDHVE